MDKLYKYGRTLCFNLNRLRTAIARDLRKQDLLGDLPLLVYDDFTTDPLVPGQMNITEISAGVAEVQKIVVSSDARFVKEVQR